VPARPSESPPIDSTPPPTVAIVPSGSCGGSAFDSKITAQGTRTAAAEARHIRVWSGSATWK
jgi:hypothetical protein